MEAAIIEVTLSTIFAVGLLFFIAGMIVGVSLVLGYMQPCVPEKSKS